MFRHIPRDVLWGKLVAAFDEPESELFKSVITDDALIQELELKPEELTEVKQPSEMMQVNHNNTITLDDYMDRLGIYSTPPTKTDALFFHHFYLTSCIVLITSEQGYLVKTRTSQGILWKEMSAKALGKILSRLTFPIVDLKGNIRDVGYDKFLSYHVINRDLERFQCVEFTTNLNPRAFPIWPGHIYPVVENPDLKLIEPFLNHVKTIICRGDEKLYDTEMMKNAWIVQNPDSHLGWATVLVGEQGTGKTIYTDILCNLWGPRFSQPNIGSIDQITGDKSRKILENQKLIVCNEISSTDTNHGRKINWDTVKSRITDDTISVRCMYRDFETAIRNVSNYIFVTNHLNSIKMEDGDRRYFVLDVSSAKKQDKDYFEDLLQKCQVPGFYSALLSYLIHKDVSTFQPNHPLMTDLKREMMEATMSYPETFIREEFMKLLQHHDRIEVRDVWDHYISWLDEQGVNSSKFAGTKQGFYAKVRHLIKSEKIGGTRYYSPLSALG
jgi:hypothetical protein